MCCGEKQRMGKGDLEGYFNQRGPGKPLNYSPNVCDSKAV